MGRGSARCDRKTYPRLIDRAHMLDDLGFPEGYYGNRVPLQVSPTWTIWERDSGFPNMTLFLHARIANMARAFFDRTIAPM